MLRYIILLFSVYSYAILDYRFNIYFENKT